MMKKLLLVLTLFLTMFLVGCYKEPIPANVEITVDATIIEIGDLISCSTINLFNTTYEDCERKKYVIIEYEYEEKIYTKTTYPSVWLNLEVGQNIKYSFYEEENK